VSIGSVGGSIWPTTAKIQNVILEVKKTFNDWSDIQLLIMAVKKVKNRSKLSKVMKLRNTHIRYVTVKVMSNICVCHVW